MPCEKSVRIDKVPIIQAFKRPGLLLYLPQFNFIPGALSLQRVFDDFRLDYNEFTKRFPEFTLRGKSRIINLSGGERRLAELYVIVSAPSQFAMLDEPFTHLNPIQIEKVKDLLTDAKEKKGLLITDHMYWHIMDVSDDIYLLVDGKTHLTKSLEDIERLGYARIRT
jgi:ABC-type lipopolysaccharide export system ATPase subunit